LEEQTTITAEEYLCQIWKELKKLVNTVHKKYGLKWRDRKPSAGATNEYLLMHPVPDLWTFCIQHVAVWVETTAYTHLYIGTFDGSTFKMLEHTPAPAGGTWYTWDGEFFMHPGQVFAVWMVGTTNTELMEANVTGWRQKLVPVSR